MSIFSLRRKPLKLLRKPYDVEKWVSMLLEERSRLISAFASLHPQLQGSLPYRCELLPCPHDRCAAHPTTTI